MNSRFKKHISFHLYVDKGIYFVTARTINSKKFFDSDQKLSILTKRLNQAIKRFNLTIHAWVLLDNHYHLLFTLAEGKLLSELIKFINGGSSHDLNLLENAKGRKIWWNYWDRGIREESDFYKRFNYIHHNPIKHGYVKANGDYKYSSYNSYKKKFGEEFLLDVEKSYPVIDFTDIHDVE